MTFPDFSRPRRPSATRPAAIALLLAAMMLEAATAWAVSSGPQPAMTGAPALGDQAAEGICTSCHNSSALNPDQDGTLSVQGVPEQYVPGQAYSLTVSISHKDASVLRWGFQMTAIALESGEGAGEFLATDAATTQVLAAMSGSRSYVEHAYGGTAIGQTGAASWTFQWKAPAAAIGPVGFFAAANAANADGSNQGDRIYSSSPEPLARTAPADP